MSISTEEVLKYLQTPADLRPAVGFDRSKLAIAPAFDGDQVRRFECLTKLETPLDQRAHERLLIDLSWASSHLEGNTYSQLDTKALIEWGQKNPDKPDDEAVMILNHKQAILLLLNGVGVPLSLARIQALHRVLSDPRDTQESRHFLPKELQGHFRDYGEIVIAGSSYFPETTPGRHMEAHVERIVATAVQSDPINAAFYLMTRLPYLQPFMDVNKRTSRLAANIPLLEAGLAPFSFVGLDKGRYLSGLVAFYELGHEDLLKTAFVDSYCVSALQHRAQSAEDRIQLINHRAQLVNEIRSYVLEGTAPTHPFLLAQVAKCDPSERAPEASDPGM